MARLMSGCCCMRSFARVIDHLVVVLSLIGLVAQQGVASRIVEDDDVVEFYVSQTLHTAVVPVRPLDVALAVEDRHGMLGKRHGERCLRDARSVAHLGDGEVVAREEALLQGRGGNDVVWNRKRLMK